MSTISPHRVYCGPPPPELLELLERYLGRLAVHFMSVPRKERCDALILIAKATGIYQYRLLAAELSTHVRITARQRRWTHHLLRHERRSTLLGLARATGYHSPLDLAIVLDDVLESCK
ncbi:hypothetical protein AURDEDRAFT_174137 [Auricularia subglabra TFB-10046 SS5]|nr:hypothetical protein AURDEDRAFT_174137 [Auricularia subglabra TFB-10046 SS5]